MNKRRNGAGWNADQPQGQKTAFTLSETDHLSDWLITQAAWHDLALLSLAVESLLRAEDLLALRVCDLHYSDGSMRDIIGRKQRKNQRGVFPALTPATKFNLQCWLQVSGKAPNHFLFTRTKAKAALPITRQHYARLVKRWAEQLGHPPDDYSTHSLRRTKPVHLFWQAEAKGQGERMLVLLSKLLGHKSVDVTTEYLGITQRRATEVTLAHPMVKAAPHLPKAKGRRR